MKREIIIPIITAIAGVVIGFLIFGNNSTPESEQKKKDQIWTCSMHPQIRKNESGDCPICGMDLIPIDESAGNNPLVFSMTPDAIRIANIQTSPVRSTGGQSNGLTLSGRLMSDETAASSLVTHIPGRIEKLYVSFTGERVYKGQKIAKIYSPKLISAQGELLEAYKIRDKHPELLEASKNKLRFWKISESEINQIIKKQRVQETFDIRAEHTGVISKRHVNVGDHLMEGGLLFDLQNLNSLWAVFDVYEKDLGSVSIGDIITFTTPALKGEKFASKVVFIDPMINPATRTAAVRLEIPNSKSQLKPDMFITGTIQTENSDERNQLFVPKSSVLWTGERSVVYIKLPGTDVPTFEYREILLGNAYGNQYEVLEGLKLEDEVVTNGAFVIDASAQLNNRSSMMNHDLLGVETKKKGIATPNFSEETPGQFKAQLLNVIHTYLEMKDELVASEKDNTQKIAKELKKALKKVDMKLLNGEAHMYWMDKAKIINDATDKIIAGKNIDIQRGSFDELSVSLISVSQAFGMYEEKLFIQYCPMVENKKGAYWLSTKRFIRNPYFGDQMLKCGEVKDSIRKID